MNNNVKERDRRCKIGKREGENMASMTSKVAESRMAVGHNSCCSLANSVIYVRGTCDIQ